jgi:hypothetical protein
MASATATVDQTAIAAATENARETATARAEATATAGAVTGLPDTGFPGGPGSGSNAPIYLALLGVLTVMITALLISRRTMPRS